MTPETQIPTRPVVVPAPSDSAVIEAAQKVSPPIRVAMACPGIGRTRRGFERALLDAHASLSHRAELELSIYGGAKVSGRPVHWTPSLSRNGKFAKAIAWMAGRDAYFWEKVSFAVALSIQLRRDRPDVVYYADVTVGSVLRRLGRRFGRSYCLLYMNGSPTPPAYLSGDLNQEMTLPAYKAALEALGDGRTLCHIPHGLRFDEVDSDTSSRRTRPELGLPEGRKTVLSVGQIDCQKKRMDYVVREVAQLPTPRPFLMMLGQFCGETPRVTAEAEKLLGKRGVDFDIRSVPPEEVGDYYAAADVFAMASLDEGFGLVYAESLSWGLPTLCHNNPVTEYVVGRPMESADLRQPGALACLIETSLDEPLDSQQRKVRREEVRRKFDWRNLEDDYVAMFQRAALMAPKAGSTPSQGRRGRPK